MGADNTPGYGFLSENAKFSEVVKKHGIIYWTSSDTNFQNGRQNWSKRNSKKYGLPIIEGSEGNGNLIQGKIFVKIGYPVLIKAAGGGGGKGMKIVEEEINWKPFLIAKTKLKFLEMIFTLKVFKILDI